MHEAESWMTEPPEARAPKFSRTFSCITEKGFAFLCNTSALSHTVHYILCDLYEGFVYRGCKGQLDRKET